MAWMGAIIAASACADDGRQRRKPNRLLLIMITFGLFLGAIVPLVIFLGMSGNESYSFFPIILMIFIIVGILASAAIGFSEFVEQEIGTEDPTDNHPRYSGYPYKAEKRQKVVSYHRNKPTEDYYWESEQKSIKLYCTNCGTRLSADDLFCYSCGWRVK